MRLQIKKLMEDRVKYVVQSKRDTECELSEKEKQLLQRKINLANNRNAEIVKCIAEGQIINRKSDERNLQHVHYIVHMKYIMKQSDRIYLEEQCERRVATFENDHLIDDIRYISKELDETEERAGNEVAFRDQRDFTYNRLAAVRYAERWWNSYNPSFKKFHVDCTNYISQCLHAGNAPMTGYPNRNKGWWMQHNNWSYSWAVAHSFRWYLSNPKNVLKAKEVKSPTQLLLGDVICYDFQGNGRFDHTTIVVAKDENGMPLVNAHTTNSRMRYWSYEDSSAYTTNIKYKFFSINQMGEAR